MGSRGIPWRIVPNVWLKDDIPEIGGGCIDFTEVYEDLSHLNGQ
jgi:hypothetical protein|nr:hypothetical protein [Metabacillus litoralis]